MSYVFRDAIENTPAHYGGKMLFRSDGTLMMTTGDGFEYREAALTLNLMGKIIRINTDGSIPADNPSLMATTDTLPFGHLDTGIPKGWI